MANLAAGCLFCKIIRREIPCHKLAETEKALAFLDINPLSAGHTLIIPKYHGERLPDIPEDYLTDILPLARKAAIAVGVPDFNVLQNNGALAHQVRHNNWALVPVCGAVPHVHFHMIPKTTEEDGLGVGWPQQPTDHAKFAALAEQLRGRM